MTQIINKICPISGSPFSISIEDQNFYQSIEVPLPTISPLERARRRMSFGPMVTTMYRRKCDATGKDLITYYHPQTPIKVYDRQYWYSDDFDPKAYSRDYDPSRSFFAQFRDLLWDVPKYQGVSTDSENCEYALLGRNNKNCYLICGSNNENTMYTSSSNSHDIIDSLTVYRSQICYECINCVNLYNVKYAIHSQNCSDCLFLYDCSYCQDCIMCVGLHNKQYCFQNKQLSKEEYLQIKSKYYTGSYQALERMKKEFQSFLNKFPIRVNHNMNCENVVGDFMIDSQNCHTCIQGAKSSNCHYCIPFCNEQKNCYDNTAARSENCYESTSRSNLFNCKFCHEVKESSNLDYCYEIVATCHDLFGCVGLKTNSEYMILNKQYTKDEYFALREKIIADMIKSDEWGEFFPSSISLFPYQDSHAQEMFPILNEQIENYENNSSLGLVNLGGSKKLLIRQQTEDEKINLNQNYIIEDDIKAYQDNIEKQQELLQTTLICQTTGYPYRIQHAELYFYIKNELPIPRESFYARHPRRAKEIMRANFVSRQCGNCQKQITTVYDDISQEVWCTNCYDNQKK